MAVLRRLTEANFKASGMPIGIIDALDGSILVGIGWQEICTVYHRVHAITAERCRESDDYIKAHLTEGEPTEYRCRNGLRDIGIPIIVAGQHLATLFMGQFLYEGETADRDFFVQQARQMGFDEAAYLRAVDRVPVFSRAAIENILAYNMTLARFISDVAGSALRQAQEIRARVQAEEELRNLNRAKDEFLGVLSHELRNPLAPIRNAIYVLRHTDSQKEQARRAQRIIERQTDHLTRLVNDLLDVSRIARGKVELRCATVDLAEIVRSTAEDYWSTLRERDIEFTTNVPDGPLWVNGDETRLAQMIGNLLGNAAKFTPENGSVGISLTRTADDSAELRVRDTGVGIAPELLPRIFQPFAQAEQGLVRTGGGLGLGLALVRGLADLHGGTVVATSEGSNRGAEFTVRLPLVAAPASRPESGRARAVAVPQRRRVMVVEDNRDAAESLAEIVRLLGHEVQIAFDGPTAVEHARQTVPDVVLCDIGLPGMDGYEVARALRSLGLNRTRLVAVTGYALPDDVKRAEEAGFDAHVAKPPDPEKIERLLA